MMIPNPQLDNLKSEHAQLDTQRQELETQRNVLEVRHQNAAIDIRVLQRSLHNTTTDLAAEQRHLTTLQQQRERQQQDPKFILGNEHEGKADILTNQRADLAKKKINFNKNFEPGCSIAGAAAGAAGAGAAIAQTTAVAQIASYSIVAKVAAAGGIAATTVATGGIALLGVGAAGLAGYGAAKLSEDKMSDWWYQNEVAAYQTTRDQFDDIVIRMRNMNTDVAEHQRLRNSLNLTEARIISSNAQLNEYQATIREINLQLISKENTLASQATMIANLDSQLNDKKIKINELENKINQILPQSPEASPSFAEQGSASAAITPSWVEKMSTRATKLLTKTNEERMSKLADYNSQVRKAVLEKLIPKLPEQDRVSFVNEAKKRNWISSLVNTEASSSQQR
ncbi:hypothetical protein [Rickettsiales endosymbiont of Stachyamoeba lipophora]|uniref:hypothetical protein n=1 Tax=Rickettsiales endosymbiont of Stachyamoeba lipophora TaxID=2486578 RepID=UPI000F648D50|nr:hypothetical protein [Rickettsiales endosymbiont of Stachyamoeba lipophora]AZL15512.1 hypothetical protein EF513_02955 [Rickettsiales endosymbiont of Stachyamoeba lipophora]